MDFNLWTKEGIPFCTSDQASDYIAKYRKTAESLREDPPSRSPPIPRLARSSSYGQKMLTFMPVPWHRSVNGLTRPGLPPTREPPLSCPPRIHSCDAPCTNPSGRSTRP
jgi:hypothetical protein